MTDVGFASRLIPSDESAPAGWWTVSTNAPVIPSTVVRRYTPVIDHLTEGLERVPDQYQGKPYLGAYFAIFLRQVELLHDAAEAIPAAFDVDRAVGFRLDWLGKMVGQPRRGSNDPIFRKWVKARILANRSTGKNPDVRKVAVAVLSDVTYWAESLAITVETTDRLDQETAHAVVEILQAASPCVPVFLVYWPVEDVPFTFASATDPEEDEGSWDSTLGTETDDPAGAWSAEVVVGDPA